MKITFTINLLEDPDAPLTMNDVAHQLDLAQGEIVHIFQQKCETAIEENGGQVWTSTAEDDSYRVSL